MTEEPQIDKAGNPIIAIYDLPIHFWIAADILGTSTPSGLGALRFNVLTPVRESDAAIDIVSAPELPGCPSDSPALGDRPWVMNYAAWTKEPGIAICRIALVAQFRDNEGLPDAPWQGGDATLRLQDALGRRIETWFEIVRSWVEVSTGQDLNYRHPVYDAVTPGDGLRVWSGSEFETPGGLVLTTPHVIPLQAARWPQILLAAQEERLPPLEYLFARDARSAFRRGDYRRAVSDAGTAIEIILNAAFDDLLAPLDAMVRQALQKENRTLGRLSDFLLRAGADLGFSKDELRSAITARNRAVHSGIVDSTEVALAVVDMSTALVSNRGSLTTSS